VAEGVAADHVIRIVSAMLAFSLPIAACFEGSEPYRVAAVAKIHFIDDLAQTVTPLEFELLE